MKYQIDTIPEYIEAIKNSSYLHCIRNEEKKLVHTINQCFSFNSIYELEKYIKTTLFTDRQILKLGMKKEIVGVTTRIHYGLSLKG